MTALPKQSLNFSSDAAKFNIESSLVVDPYCNVEEHRKLAVCDDRQTRIAIAAYYRAAERGFAAGYELYDWLQAEKEIDLEDWLAAERKLEDIVA
jgi:hypothetical protein